MSAKSEFCPLCGTPTHDNNIEIHKGYFTTEQIMEMTGVKDLSDMGDYSKATEEYFFSELRVPASNCDEALNVIEQYNQLAQSLGMEEISMADRFNDCIMIDAHGALTKSLTPFEGEFALLELAREQPSKGLFGKNKKTYECYEQLQPYKDKIVSLCDKLIWTSL